MLRKRSISLNFQLPSKDNLKALMGPTEDSTCHKNRYMSQSHVFKISTYFLFLTCAAFFLNVKVTREALPQGEGHGL